MRLINVKTTRLSQFFGNIPDYAILSHTWGKDEDELTMQDLTPSESAVNGRGPGWDKLAGLCKQASADGLEWAWLDTCCIDKTSSTELGEAINSMFRWYQKAKVCYAYLSDVDDKRRLEHSRWFTRGWTLQELLAPRHVRFFDSEWNVIGTKKELSVKISEITGIPNHFLLGIAPLREASVAQRMSWASKRETKRVEDVAYSLLGIFGLTMPMIYGEENMAFVRLQEEIMRRISDDSILAWQADPIGIDESDLPIGALAMGPTAFASSGDIIPCHSQTAPSIEPLHIQGGSLLVRRPLAHLQHDYLVLSCYRKGRADVLLGIPISSGQSSDRSADIHFRLTTSLLESTAPRVTRPNDVIRVHATLGQVAPSTTLQRVPPIYIDNTLGIRLRLLEVIPEEIWDRDTDMIAPRIDEKRYTWQAFIRFGSIESDFHFIVVLDILDPHSDTSYSNHHVMVCRRRTATDTIARSFAEFSSAARGNHYASDGVLNLGITLHQELVGRQMMFVMKFQEFGDGLPPTALTVDSDYEMAHLQHEKNMIEMLIRDLDHARDIKETSCTIQGLEKTLKKDQDKLSSVEESIAKLEGQRSKLRNSLADSATHLAAAHKNLRQQEAAREILFDNLRTVDSKLRNLPMICQPGTNEVRNWIEDLACKLLSQSRETNLFLTDFATADSPTMFEQLLFYAVGNGWLAVARVLVAHGADVNSYDDDGAPLLWYARNAGNEELMSFLISCGAHE